MQASNPALSRARLSWVDQNYIRGDTITAAAARFVDALTTKAPLPGGAVSKASGSVTS